MYERDADEPRARGQLQQPLQVPLAEAARVRLHACENRAVLEPQQVPAVEPVVGRRRLDAVAVRLEPAPEQRRLEVTAYAVVPEEQDVARAIAESAIGRERQCSGLGRRVEEVQLGSRLLQHSHEPPPLWLRSAPVDALTKRHERVEQEVDVE